MTFVARDYAGVRDWLSAVFPLGSAGRYLVEILDDAISARLGDAVSMTTSMHDLVFSPSPVASAYDAVIVRSPSSLHSPRIGNLRVDVVQTGGQTTSIERPIDQALAAFWSAMRDAFGVTRERDGGANRT